MFRRIAILTLALFVLPMAVLAQDDMRPLERAMALMRADNWAAAQIEARGGGQEALDVILWHYLRAGRGVEQIYMWKKAHEILIKERC